MSNNDIMNNFMAKLVVRSEYVAYVAVAVWDIMAGQTGIS